MSDNERNDDVTNTNEEAKPSEYTNDHLEQQVLDSDDPHASTSDQILQLQHQMNQVMEHLQALSMDLKSSRNQTMDAKQSMEMGEHDDTSAPCEPTSRDEYYQTMTSSDVKYGSEAHACRPQVNTESKFIAYQANLNEKGDQKPSGNVQPTSQYFAQPPPSSRSAYGEFGFANMGVDKPPKPI